jgi:hypothetical protein
MRWQGWDWSSLRNSTSGGSARHRAPVPGCRHGLLPRSECACAPIAYGVPRRLGYKVPTTRNRPHPPPCTR